MAARSVVASRVNATAAGALFTSSRISAQQLSRFHSLRSPSSSTQLAIRPQIKATPSQPSLGLRMQSNSAPATGEVKLDWDSFFKLRASRRRYSLASSLVTSLATTTIGVQVLSSQDLESLGAQVMGLDPFIVLGMATAACGAVGWLAGPIVGNGLWSLVNRRFTSSVKTASIPAQSFKAKVLTAGCIEGEGVLRSHSPLPRGPFDQLDREPGAGLLRREDWQRARLSPVAEGPAGL